MSLSASSARVHQAVRDIGDVQYNKRLADKVVKETSKSIDTIKNLLTRADDAR